MTYSKTQSEALKLSRTYQNTTKKPEHVLENIKVGKFTLNFFRGIMLAKQLQCVRAFILQASGEQLGVNFTVDCMSLG